MIGPIAAVAIGVWMVRTHPPGAVQPLAAGSLRGVNVLLVTIDTLRADHVGAYGRDGALTPTIDGLAKDGLRFERTYAHVPLTLPSHTTILTGAYPTRTGVRDNGAFHLPDQVETLATMLKRAGYRTGAFVGAFVLDARFGLSRGFDVYDDRMLGSGSTAELAERPAEQVLAAASAWLAPGTPAPGTPAPSTAAPSTPAPGTSHQAPGTRQQAPWLAWIHLYDPHEPYAPPEPYRSRYAAEPYDGEIAYADAALGQFLGRLRSAHALDDTLIVLLSDHGESLGEHGERTHGLFAYDATLRVPLVMYAAGHIGPGLVRDAMRLVDVAPTVLDLLGVPAFRASDGRSVRPFIAGERPFDDPGSYFEALNANLTRDWAPLTGIVQANRKLIDLPIPELYDLAADPGEADNIYARHRDEARDLEARLDTMAKTAAPAAAAPVDADAQARLRALGYVVATSARPARTHTANDDPKRLVHLNAALDDAAASWSRGDRQAAVDTLRQVIKERPTMTIAYDRLAFMLRASGRISDAVALLDEAARAGHADRALLRTLGEMLRDAGELPRSAAVLEPLVRDDPSDLEAADALGQTYARAGRARDAEALFKRVLASSPNAAATWNNLGSLYLTQSRGDQAVDALSRAVAINPTLATAHNGLGVAYARRGEMEKAIGEWRRALELRPDYQDARDNLSRVQR